MSSDDNFAYDDTQKYLANERTFLAWIRTCIALIALGFIIAKLNLFLSAVKYITFNHSSMVNQLSMLESQSITNKNSSIIGTAIVIFSIVLVLLALKNYRDNNVAISQKTFRPNYKIFYLVFIG